MKTATKAMTDAHRAKRDIAHDEIVKLRNVVAIDNTVVEQMDDARNDFERVMVVLKAMEKEWRKRNNVDS
jgi:uncharacterized coiled-coil DUF342 family protein